MCDRWGAAARPAGATAQLSHPSPIEGPLIVVHYVCDLLACCTIPQRYARLWPVAGALALPSGRSLCCAEVEELPMMAAVAPGQPQISCRGGRCRCSLAATGSVCCETWEAPLLSTTPLTSRRCSR